MSKKFETSHGLKLLPRPRWRVIWKHKTEPKYACVRLEILYKAYLLVKLVQTNTFHK